MSEFICEKVASCIDSYCSIKNRDSLSPLCGDKKTRDNCIRFFDKRNNPSCTENKKTYTIHNDNHLKVLCLHLDNGAFQTSRFQKCDFVFAFCEKRPRILFVELKGKHAREALEQLESTLNQPILQPLLQGEHKVYGRISTNARVPNLRSSDKRIADLEKKLMKRFISLHGNLKWGSVNFCEQYKEMDTI